MKYAKYILVVLIFLVPVSLWLQRKIESDSPSFILDKLKDLRANNVLMASIGDFRAYEYTYNELDFKNEDTVKYSITITGYTGKLIYEGVAVKPPSRPWELVKDTITVNP